MPSANMHNGSSGSNSDNANPISIAAFSISSKDMEGLVMEIKENLRVSASCSMKALPCGHLSAKSSRASPYRVPGKICTCGVGGALCDCRKLRHKHPQNIDEDPYELLQRLLRDGGLVNEAVKRVQLGLAPKTRYFYESDDDSSPILRLCSLEPKAKCFTI